MKQILKKLNQLNKIPQYEFCQKNWLSYQKDKTYLYESKAIPLFRRYSFFAHIENIYKVDCGHTWFYNQFKKLGWSKEDVDMTMRVCGASYPLGSTIGWPLPAEQVLKNLKKHKVPAVNEFKKIFANGGLCPAGYDKFGFNVLGFDSEGFDSEGFDNKGRDYFGGRKKRRRANKCPHCGKIIKPF